MKRIALALLTIGAVNFVSARYNTDNREEVRSCKRQCFGTNREKKSCYSECERSVGRNFAHGLGNIVRGGVQAGSAGLLPVTEEGMDEARNHEYNPIRNIGTGLRDTAEGVVQTGSLGFAGRNWQN